MWGNHKLHIQWTYKAYLTVLAHGNDTKSKTFIQRQSKTEIPFLVRRAGHERLGIKKREEKGDGYILNNM